MNSCFDVFRNYDKRLGGNTLKETKKVFRGTIQSYEFVGAIVFKSEEDIRFITFLQC